MSVSYRVLTKLAAGSEFIKLYVDDLISMGIEEARAEALTDMGCEDITTNGDFIYYAGECVGTVEFFIRETNEADFDYESGTFQQGVT